jgi:hypothetical protein
MKSSGPHWRAWPGAFLWDRSDKAAIAAFEMTVERSDKPAAMGAQQIDPTQA